MVRSWLISLFIISSVLGQRVYPAKQIDGLIGWWPLDQTGGVIAFDRSGNEINGTLTDMDPATDWVVNSMGTVLDFDGVDDHISVTMNHNIGTGEFTWSCWLFLRTKLTGQAYRGQMGMNTFQPGFLWNVNASDNWGAFFGSDRNTGVSLNTGQWYHLVMTRNSNSELLFYRDTILDFTATGVTTNMANGTLSIGRRQVTGSDVDGFIRDVRFYNRSLKVEEIREVMLEFIQPQVMQTLAFFGKAPAAAPSATPATPKKGKPFIFGKNYIESNDSLYVNLDKLKLR